MRAACQDEVTELHRFFQQWFAGDLPDTPGAFARFAEVLAPDFEMISPAGLRRARGALLEALRAAHGKDPESKIWVREFTWRAVGEGLYQVTYEEWQRHTGTGKGRLSSVLFGRKAGLPNGVQWLHLHEAWLPEGSE